MLANIAGLYAVHHGPNGLKRIAERVHGLAKVLTEGLTRLGCQVTSEMFFDTIRVASESIKVEQDIKPVSYTHLPLPTLLLV